MSVINTNITSMIGQSNLNKSQNALQTSMERLSSGLRINSAKDDAAGQAIANRMTSQVTGLAQAQRNANDGISIAQTAEGSLNQVNDNLQRIRELSVQASNGTNSQNDLQSIQDEIGQRLAEIDRISEETSFNGVDVLASNQGLQIQVGANDGQTITVNLQEINAETLNLGDFNVNGAQAATGNDVLAAAQDEPADGDTIEVGGTTYTYHDEVDNDDGNAFTGWSTLDAAGLGGADDAATAAAATEFSEIEEAVADNDGVFEASFGGETYEVDAEGVVTDGTDQIYVEEGEFTADPEVIATEGPMAALDAALNQVDSLRSELGAVQNRFEDAITNLNTNETNLSAARSRIEDADYAVEVGDMTRAQILQQAGTSVLAQANQIPQNVLSLLG